MAMPLPAQLHLTLPLWVLELDLAGRDFAGDEAKVAFAIELSRRNVEARSGGPFGAAVFDGHDGWSPSASTACCNKALVAHAETHGTEAGATAPAAFATQRGWRADVLATSSQPCCQCYGASFWAGIDRLLIGARAEDVMALTEFDEGPLPADWVGELERRGIAVARDLLRPEACAVLRSYGELGGTFY